MGEIFTYRGIGKSFWLICDLAWTSRWLKQPVLWPISALTIREKNAAKNHNEITVVQIFKTKPGGHCGCGFRKIPASVRTDFVIKDTVSIETVSSLKDTASHSQNNSC